MYSSRSNVVSIRTAASSSGSERIRPAALRPSSSGMRMSMRTTSGRVRVTMSTALRPSGASPTTVMSGSSSRITRKPERTSCWSSATTTLISFAGAVAAGGGCSSSRHRTRGLEELSHPATRHPADYLGGEDLTARGGIAQPARDDHRGPVEVVPLRQGLARVEAHAEHELSGRRRGALHVYGAAHRGDGAREGDHQSVAGRLDLAAAVLVDRPAQRGEVLAAHRIRGLVPLALE